MLRNYPVGMMIPPTYLRVPANRWDAADVSELPVPSLAAIQPSYTQEFVTLRFEITVSVDLAEPYRQRMNEHLNNRVMEAERSGEFSVFMEAIRQNQAELSRVQSQNRELESHLLSIRKFACERLDRERARREK